MLLPLDHDTLRVPVEGGAHLHVARYGFGGDPVVFLHGFGTSSFLWRRVGPLIAVRHATAFAIDLLGYGESDRPFDGDFGLTAQATYVDRAFTALQIQRATVVGLDIGGIVALRLAYDRPERVFRLGLVGPPALNDLAGPEIRELQRDTARYALRLSRGLFGAASLLRPYLETSVADSASMPPALVGRYLAPYLGSEGAGHLLALAGAINEADVEDIDLKRVRQRTLVLRGTRDRWCTRTVAESYADEIPKGHYEHVDEVGHLVPDEDPESLARLVLAFAQTAESDPIEDERSEEATRTLGGS
jgi:pimeloyl-ACP methyl ester carboxylesterase